MCSVSLALFKTKSKGSDMSSAKQKDSALNLAKFVDKKIVVKLSGGREVVGVLKGYDQLLNIVLDEAIENMRDPEDHLRSSGETRGLGLIVCRGTSVMLVSPMEGTEEIENPFTSQ